MSKYVRRIIPFGSGDIPAVQRWLEDMAEKGLFFKECGLLFAKFTKGEPKKMRYRLDFCYVVACDIPEEKKEEPEPTKSVISKAKKALRERRKVTVHAADPNAAAFVSRNQEIIRTLLARLNARGAI